MPNNNKLTTVFLTLIFFYAQSQRTGVKAFDPTTHSVKQVSKSKFITKDFAMDTVLRLPEVKESGLWRA